MSPTSRSLANLRERGYRCEVVERFNSFTKQRKDLFGFVDIVAIREGETVGVQTTSGSNMAARIKKIADSETVSDVRKAGWKILVQGWTKNSKGRYILREVDVS